MSLKENPEMSEDKENIILKMRENIEKWREERFQRLSSRLLKCRKSAVTENCVVSPSVLGMKCPKSIRSRFDPSNKDCQGRKPFSDLKMEENISKEVADKSPSSKKKHKKLVIHHTLTSRLRILQSHPVISYENNYNHNQCADQNDKTYTEVMNVEDHKEIKFSTPAPGKYEPLHSPNCISAIKHQVSPSHHDHGPKLRLE